MILHFENKTPVALTRPVPLPAAATALVDLGQELARTHYRFVTPTPATIALVNARPGNQRARSLVDVFGWNREFSQVMVPEAIFNAMREAGVLAETGSGLRSKVRVSSIGDRLYFHSSFPTLAPDSVFFGPDTYRFARQLRASVPLLPGRISRCVDVGCGSGAGAIELARMCPSASVHAVDINPAALALTRVNALLADAPGVLAEYSDMLDNVGGTFDLIVANPPYLVDEGERRYRHGGGDLGGAVSLALVNAAIARLAPGGTLMLYTASAIVDGVDLLGDEMAARLGRAGMTWTYDEIDPDIFGEELHHRAYAAADRIAAVWLVATKPASHKVYW